MIIKNLNNTFKNGDVGMSLHDDEHHILGHHDGRPDSVLLNLGHCGCNYTFHIEAHEFHQFTRMVKAIDRAIVKAERRIVNDYVN